MFWCANEGPSKPTPGKHSPQHLYTWQEAVAFIRRSHLDQEMLSIATEKEIECSNQKPLATGCHDAIYVVQMSLSARSIPSSSLALSEANF